MKNLLKFTFVLFFILIISVGYSQSYLDNNKFSIKFPIEAKPSTADVPTTDYGTFKMYSYMTEGYDAIHMFSYIDYSEAYMNTYTTSNFFQSAMSGFTTSLKISVVEQNDIMKTGHSGHYYKAYGATEGGSYYCIKYDYIVKNRFYQLGILRVDRYPTSYEISTFIDSFKIKTSGSVTNNNYNNNDNKNEIKRPEPLPE